MLIETVRRADSKLILLNAGRAITHTISKKSPIKKKKKQQLEDKIENENITIYPL